MALTCKGKINLRENKVYDKCSNTCDFTYSYRTSPSSCKIKSMGSGNGGKSQYLDLKCFDGNNDINYSSLGNIEINEARLYSPSLNKWNGKRLEAELILQHIGNGKQVYVCIPVRIGGKNGVSVDWFKKLQLKTLPTRKGAISNPTSPNFRLDDVIPIGGYYVMKKNGLSFKNCNPGNNIMILFSSENPAYIGRNELNLLQQRVNTSSSGHHTVGTGEIIYNESGTAGSSASGRGGSGGEVMESECYQITDEDGNPITDEEGKPWGGESTEWVKNLWKNTDMNMWVWKAIFFVHKYWFIFVWMPVLILLYIVYRFKIPIRIARFMQGLFNKKNKKSSDTSSSSDAKSKDTGNAKKIDVIDELTKK